MGVSSAVAAPTIRLSGYTSAIQSQYHALKAEQMVVRGVAWAIKSSIRTDGVARTLNILLAKSWDQRGFTKMGKLNTKWMEISVTFEVISTSNVEQIETEVRLSSTFAKHEPKKEPCKMMKCRNHGFLHFLSGTGLAGSTEFKGVSEE
ncbi:hypothetical protein VNO77_15053 [Canavalia gladiata]|uniref:Uncharacterized protein n=1 Tax=Canavalia gladiata TaxID=3824 RepID=A0AAN9QVP1_CANGL